MRLKELQLLKYGHFDDEMLRFPGSTPGLHIVFGPNEAGKSTALRALKALLFGIARSTCDDFLHGGDLLSVGAILESADGRSCELQRWKKTPTLRDRDGKKAADSSLLNQCLGGMDADSFQRRYGLDFDELQRGSKILLEEKGNVGTSIFSTSLGALDVRKVLTELEEKAAELFTAKARTRSINTAIANYAQLKKQIKDASLTVRTFLEKEEQIHEAAGKLEFVKQLQRNLSARKTQLERIRRTRPMIAELIEFEIQLKDNGYVAQLPGDFIAERRILSENLRKLQDEIAERTREIANVQEDISKLHVAADVLERDADINDLQKKLRSYADARADLPGLKAKADKAREEAEFILKILRPGMPLSDAESLRLRADQITRVRGLVGEEKPLRNTHEALAAEARELEDELKTAKEKLAQMPQPCSIEHLSESIATIQRKGDLNAKLADEKQRLERLRDESETKLKRLPFWNGTLDELATIKVPGIDAISEFDQRKQRIEADLSRLATQTEGLDKTIADCSEDIARLQQSGGAIPTGQQLDAARIHRGKGWELIRRAWLKKEKLTEETRAFQAPLELPEAFEKAVLDADAIADNRFRDASRVGQHEDRIKRIETARCDRAKLAAEKQKRESELEQFRAEWRERWEPLRVNPGSVAEMRDWVVQQNDLAQRYTQLKAHERDCKALTVSISQCKQSISDALKTNETGPVPANLELDGLLDHARRFCKQQETLAQKRKALEDAIDVTLKNWRKKITLRDRAETALKEWKENWADAVAALGLRPDAMVQEAQELLAKLQDLFGRLDPIPESGKRIADISKFIDLFEVDTANLVAQLDSALGGLHPDQAIEALSDRLNKARGAHSRREQLLKQSGEAARKIERAESEIVSLKTRLEAMCVTAECGEPAELDAVERRFEKQSVLQAKIDELKRAIFNAGDNWKLSALLAEIEDVNADELDAEYEQTVEGLADRDAEFHAVHETLARLKSEREAMDGKASAAEAASQAQHILARIRDETEQYVRLRAAAEILKREIERYRDENQGPLLGHASTIFAKLTLGNFSGVRADLDERGQNALYGIRKNGQPLGVEGMSDGTRDQLYLALRLAFLPLYLEKEENEPLPFVIDDVLINFDDIRCAAAFKYLYEIAARVQVIVFTHHKHIVDLANAALPGATCQKEASGTLEVYSFGNA